MKTAAVLLAAVAAALLSAIVVAQPTLPAADIRLFNTSQISSSLACDYVAFGGALVQVTVGVLQPPSGIDNRTLPSPSPLAITRELVNCTNETLTDVNGSFVASITVNCTAVNVTASPAPVPPPRSCACALDDAAWRLVFGGDPMQCKDGLVGRTGNVLSCLLAAAPATASTFSHIEGRALGNSTCNCSMWDAFRIDLRAVSPPPVRLCPPSGVFTWPGRIGVEVNMIEATYTGAPSLNVTSAALGLSGGGLPPGGISLQSPRAIKTPAAIAWRFDFPPSITPLMGRPLNGTLTFEVESCTLVNNNGPGGGGGGGGGCFLCGFFGGGGPNSQTLVCSSTTFTLASVTSTTIFTAAVGRVTANPAAGLTGMLAGASLASTLTASVTALRSDGVAIPMPSAVGTSPSQAVNFTGAWLVNSLGDAAAQGLPSASRAVPDAALISLGPACRYARAGFVACNVPLWPRQLCGAGLMLQFSTSTQADVDYSFNVSSPAMTGVVDTGLPPATGTDAGAVVAAPGCYSVEDWSLFARGAAAAPNASAVLAADAALEAATASARWSALPVAGRIFTMAPVVRRVLPSLLVLPYVDGSVSAGAVGSVELHGEWLHNVTAVVVGNTSCGAVSATPRLAAAGSGGSGSSSGVGYTGESWFVVCSALPLLQVARFLAGPGAGGSVAGVTGVLPIDVTLVFASPGAVASGYGAPWVLRLRQALLVQALPTWQALTPDLGSSNATLTVVGAGLTGGQLVNPGSASAQRYQISFETTSPFQSLNCTGGLRFPAPDAMACRLPQQADFGGANTGMLSLVVRTPSGTAGGSQKVYSYASNLEVRWWPTWVYKDTETVAGAPAPVMVTLPCAGGGATAGLAPSLPVGVSIDQGTASRCLLISSDIGVNAAAAGTFLGGRGGETLRLVTVTPGGDVRSSVDALAKYTAFTSVCVSSKNAGVYGGLAAVCSSAARSNQTTAPLLVAVARMAATWGLRFSPLLADVTHAAAAARTKSSCMVPLAVGGSGADANATSAGSGSGTGGSSTPSTSAATPDIALGVAPLPLAALALAFHITPPELPAGSASDGSSGPAFAWHSMAPPSPDAANSMVAAGISATRPASPAVLLQEQAIEVALRALAVGAGAADLITCTVSFDVTAGEPNVAPPPATTSTALQLQGLGPRAAAPVLLAPSASNTTLDTMSIGVNGSYCNATTFIVKVDSVDLSSIGFGAAATAKAACSWLPTAPDGGITIPVASKLLFRTALPVGRLTAQWATAVMAAVLNDTGLTSSVAGGGGGGTGGSAADAAVDVSLPVLPLRLRNVTFELLLPLPNGTHDVVTGLQRLAAQLACSVILTNSSTGTRAFDSFSTRGDWIDRLADAPDAATRLTSPAVPASQAPLVVANSAAAAMGAPRWTAADNGTAVLPFTSAELDATGLAFGDGASSYKLAALCTWSPPAFASASATTGTAPAQSSFVVPLTRVRAKPPSLVAALSQTALDAAGGTEQDDALVIRSSDMVIGAAGTVGAVQPAKASLRAANSTLTCPAAANATAAGATNMTFVFPETLQPIFVAMQLPRDLVSAELLAESVLRRSSTAASANASIVPAPGTRLQVAELVNCSVYLFMEQLAGSADAAASASGGSTRAGNWLVHRDAPSKLVDASSSQLLPGSSSSGGSGGATMPGNATSGGNATAAGANSSMAATPPTAAAATAAGVFVTTTLSAKLVPFGSRVLVEARCTWPRAGFGVHAAQAIFFCVHAPTLHVSSPEALSVPATASVAVAGSSSAADGSTVTLSLPYNTSAPVLIGMQTFPPVDSRSLASAAGSRCDARVIGDAATSSGMRVRPAAATAPLIGLRSQLNITIEASTPVPASASTFPRNASVTVAITCSIYEQQINQTLIAIVNTAPVKTLLSSASPVLLAFPSRLSKPLPGYDVWLQGISSLADPAASDASSRNGTLVPAATAGLRFGVRPQLAVSLLRDVSLLPPALVAAAPPCLQPLPLHAASYLATVGAPPLINQAALSRDCAPALLLPVSGIICTVSLTRRMRLIVPSLPTAAAVPLPLPPPSAADAALIASLPAPSTNLTDTSAATRSPSRFELESVAPVQFGSGGVVYSDPLRYWAELPLAEEPRELPLPMSFTASESHPAAAELDVQCTRPSGDGALRASLAVAMQSISLQWEQPQALAAPPAADAEYEILQVLERVSVRLYASTAPLLAGVPADAWLESVRADQDALMRGTVCKLSGCLPNAADIPDDEHVEAFIQRVYNGTGSSTASAEQFVCDDSFVSDEPETPRRTASSAASGMPTLQARVNASAGTATFTNFVPLGTRGGVAVLTASCMLPGGVPLRPVSAVLRLRGCDKGTEPSSRICRACTPGTYSEGGRMPCTQCPTSGVTCADGTLRLLPGWFRADGLTSRINDATLFLPAWNPAATMVRDDKNQRTFDCAEGYLQGSMTCGVCDTAAGYQRFGEACAKCPPRSQSVAILAGVMVAFLLLVAYVALKPVSATRSRGSTVLRITLSYVQQLSAVVALQAVQGSLFSQASVALETVNASPFSMGQIQCLLQLSYLQRLAFTVLFPLAVALSAVGFVVPKALYDNMLCCPTRPRLVRPGAVPLRQKLLRSLRAVFCSTRIRRACVCAREPVSGTRGAAASGGGDGSLATTAAPAAASLTPFEPPEMAGKRKLYLLAGKGCWLARWNMVTFREDIKEYFRSRRWLATAVFAAFLFYVSVVSSSLRALDCTPPILGVRYLKTDLSLQCWQGDHVAVAAVAIAALIIFGLGFPLLLFVQLRKFAAARKKKKRGVARRTAADEEAEAAAAVANKQRRARTRAALSFLMDGYDEKRGKVAFEVAILLRKAFICAVLLIPSAASQALGMALVAGSAMITQHRNRPYSLQLFNSLESTTSACVFLTAVLAIALRAAKSAAAAAALAKPATASQSALVSVGSLTINDATSAALVVAMTTVNGVVLLWLGWHLLAATLAERLDDVRRRTMKAAAAAAAIAAERVASLSVGARRQSKVPTAAAAAAIAAAAAAEAGEDGVDSSKSDSKDDGEAASKGSSTATDSASAGGSAGGDAAGAGTGAATTSDSKAGDAREGTRSRVFLQLDPVSSTLLERAAGRSGAAGSTFEARRSFADSTASAASLAAAVSRRDSVMDRTFAGMAMNPLLAAASPAGRAAAAAASSDAANAAAAPAASPAALPILGTILSRARNPRAAPRNAAAPTPTSASGSSTAGDAPTAKVEADRRANVLAGFASAALRPDHETHRAAVGAGRRRKVGAAAAPAGFGSSAIVPFANPMRRARRGSGSDGDSDDDAWGASDDDRDDDSDGGRKRVATAVEDGWSDGSSDGDAKKPPTESSKAAEDGWSDDEGDIAPAPSAAAAAASSTQSATAASSGAGDRGAAASMSDGLGGDDGWSAEEDDGGNDNADDDGADGDEGWSDTEEGVEYEPIMIPGAAGGPRKSRVRGGGGGLGLKKLFKAASDAVEGQLRRAAGRKRTDATSAADRDADAPASAAAVAAVELATSAAAAADPAGDAAVSVNVSPPMAGSVAEP